MLLKSQISQSMLWKSLYLCLLGLLCAPHLDGQEDIQFIYHFDGQETRIRWVPKDYDTWQLGNDNGYTVERLTISSNGIALDDNQILSSNVQFYNDPEKPIPENQWNSHFSEDNMYAALAKKAIYLPVENLNEEDDGIFAKVIAADSLEREKFQFGILASYMDFDVAKAMALGIIDNEVEGQKSYVYKVAITNTDIVGYLTVNTDEIKTYPMINEVSAMQEDTAILITWNYDEVKGDYVAYNIERANTRDNIYRQVNEMPYIFFESINDARPSLYATYRDLSAMPGEEYKYRVRGITPLAFPGPFSENALITMKHMRKALSFIVSSDRSIPEQVTVNWEILGLENTEEFTAFNVYRKERNRSTPVLLNDTPLSNTMTYTDLNPELSAYYFIETFDEHGISYFTNDLLVIIDDDVAPSIPLEFRGRKATRASLEFEWTHSPDEDVKGYNIYSNVPGSPDYFTINNYIIEDNIFLYEIPDYLIHEALCFKITSIDDRGNESEMSECVTMTLPDQKPPGTPLLTKIIALDEGIALGWEYSPSDDRAYHYVERKWAEGPDWEIILTIPVEEEDQYGGDNAPTTTDRVCYIDTSITDQIWYDYRMIVVDEAGNKSSSQVLSAYPSEVEGLVGMVSNFQINLDSIVSVSRPLEQEYNLINRVIEDLEDGQGDNLDTIRNLVIFNIITQEQYDEIVNTGPTDSNNAADILATARDIFWKNNNPLYANLSWSYDNTTQLDYFEVYRSHNGADFILFDRRSAYENVNNYNFSDEHIARGNFYIYKIRGVHLGGRFSEMSEGLILKVKE